MDLQNLVDAVMRALEMYDTKAIKDILRQGSYSHYIFASVTYGRPQLSVRDLLQVNGTRPENLRNPFNRFLNYYDALGNVLVHLAAYISDHELIRLLVERGADVSSIDADGRTALHIACQYASLEIIKFLTEKSPSYILDLCCENGMTPLDCACKYNCPDVVLFLLSQGSSVGAEDVKRIPVYYAVYNRVPEYATAIASLLLDAGANMNVPTWETPLICAIDRAGDETLLSENSVASQNSPYVDLCMLLIDRGCDINAADMQGRTALHWAVREDLENIVRKLLISGSDIERCDIFGDPPLHYAIDKGNQRLVDLLIISGANLQAVDWELNLERWTSSGKLNEKYTQIFHHVIHASKQCLSLENLCYIIIRKSIRNAERDATQLGLPPLVVRRLQLKD